MTNPARVVLVEDEWEVRQRLSRAVQSAPRLELAGCAGSLAEGRVLVERERPDVLLVDLGLPDGNGTALIRSALALKPDMQAMVITVFGDESHVVNAIEAGATSYLLKDASPAHIARAIGEMLDGGSPLSASVARFLLRRLRIPSPAPADPRAGDLPPPQMSPREQDVLQLVAKGLSYAEIGSILDISVNTVSTHIKQIYRKLSVTSRGQAVFEAQAHGLITPAGGARPH